MTTLILNTVSPMVAVILHTMKWMAIADEGDDLEVITLWNDELMILKSP